MAAPSTPSPASSSSSSSSAPSTAPAAVIEPTVIVHRAYIARKVQRESLIMYWNRYTLDLEDITIMNPQLPGIPVLVNDMVVVGKVLKGEITDDGDWIVHFTLHSDISDPVLRMLTEICKAFSLTNHISPPKPISVTFCEASCREDCYLIS